MTAIKQEREDVFKGDFLNNIAVPKCPKGESGSKPYDKPQAPHTLREELIETKTLWTK